MQILEVKQTEQDYRTKEAFKTLRTNVEFSGEDLQVIAVTSATPNEGTSSVSVDLAVSFAQAGKKTVLLDADLRKSVMKARHKRGKIRYGMTNCLVGKVPFEDALCETDIPNFYMVFSGPVPPNPSELLGNKSFKKVLAYCRENFDVVIIDTPPIGSVIDAAVIAKNCD